MERNVGRFWFHSSLTKSLEMKIIIQFIEPSEMRYSTCGDYYVDKDDDWQIKVSKMQCNNSMLAVALHELVEMILVMDRKIPLEEIDKFDIQYEKERGLEDDSEPGDCALAPYHEEHTFATSLERMLCEALQFSWFNHSRIVKDASQ